MDRKTNKKFVIFDLDGTILDTSSGIIAATIKVIDSLGLPRLPDEVMPKWIGPPQPYSYKKYYGLDEEAAVNATHMFRKFYADGGLFDAVPYEGIKELCIALKSEGYGISVATYKMDEQAKALLSHLGLSEIIPIIHGSDKRESIKKSVIIHQCIEEMGGTPELSVLVGDSTFDSTAAMEAGIDFIGVTYGFGFESPKDLEKIPHIGVAATPSEILDIL